ncbi:MAG: DNA phosphorothioation-associated putative methyltransferase, partial [Verrucomicrobiae bacterium]|nr:DNA phosphorothioation-associated putative methyltransferase [Verrucomicrobiae bacterium]
MDLLPEKLSLADYKAALEGLKFGKFIPTAIYVIADDSNALPKILQELVDLLRIRLEFDDSFNVIKLGRRELKVSFLSYPDFFSGPHPHLSESVGVDLVTGKVRRTQYGHRENPPILHRKETFLPNDHPDVPKFRRLTEEEEEAGLYEDTSTIGFKLNWERLLAKKGLGYRGHRLIEIGTSERNDVSVRHRDAQIDRHRAAIARSEFSRPIKLLLNHGQLRRCDRFFDYGCGLGDDVNGLKELEYAATGWDPFFAPHETKQRAEVVSLGFVLNVIEDPAERVEVLVDAWRHTERLLVVSTLVAGRENYACADRFGDGLLTNRNTFQKYFESDELLGLIEHALHVDPVPVEVGICFVFRDVSDQQDFLSQRTKRSVDWEQVNLRLRLLRPKRVRLSTYDRDPELLDEFWKRMLELGRIPRRTEFDRFDDVRQLCQSVNQAERLFVEKFGDEPLKEARLRRREDLLVYLAGGEFQKRRTPLSHLSAGLRFDLKTFFGHYSMACDEARELLFAAGDSDEIEAAIEDLDFGWLDAKEGHFTIHRSLIPSLPPILRIYIECAARLFGDPGQADLIKLHLYSGKLTFQHYDAF